MAKKSKNKKKKNRKKKSNSNCEEEKGDLLSSLPDDILINILSHLPTKTAVATSVLSHRWRGLWTQIDSLEFKTNHFKNKHYSFMLNSIGKLLTMITSPCIRKFTLDLTQGCNFSNDVTYLKTILHQLCARNVEHIQVDMDPCRQCSWMPGFPHCVFQTPSLAVLELDTMFFYKLPSDDDDEERINLPNLNKLRICLPKHSCRALSKLISSCPSLKDLSLRIDTSQYPQNKHVYLDISSQSLKHLDIDMPWFSYEKAKILINAPKLIKLNVCYDLDGIGGLEQLIGSLESCPILEDLVLRLGIDRKDSINTPPTACPSVYVSTHLKRIDMNINDIISYHNLLLIIEYLLSSSRVMEQLIIDISLSCRELRSCEELQLCERLYKLPKSLLLRCQIVFKGLYFEAWVPKGGIIMSCYWKEVKKIRG